MKIAILGSAGSVRLAPFGDTSWKIFGCSPGVFPVCPRVDAWFELHRWEPGIVGRAETQKPWFSPEYVLWMSKLKCNVWMQAPVPEIPHSVALPIDDLSKRYGTYNWTSSIAYMIACAIEDILDARKNGSTEPDTIGLWGVDMAATEEYGFQRAGCQHFLCLAADLGIQIIVPPESDLLRPMPRYGIDEGSHWMIKNTERLRELRGRLNNAEQTQQNANLQVAFLKGAIDDVEYQMKTWGGDRPGMGADPALYLHSPELVKAVLKQHLPEPRPDLVPVAPPAPRRPAPKSKRRH